MNDEKQLRRNHIRDFLLFLGEEKDVFLYGDGKVLFSAPLITEHLETLALETVAAKGMAVGSAEAEVSQVEIDADLAEVIYKAEGEL
jgi:hypothetical protein